MTESTTYYLPTNIPASGGYVLTTSNTGVLSWSATAAATSHTFLNSTYHSDTSTAGPARGGLITGQGASPSWALLSPPVSGSGQLLRYTGTDASWSTATYPGSTTANYLLYSSSANTIGELTSAASSILVTNGSSVPSFTAISTDTFTQYALLAGRSGGQTLIGGTAANNTLTIQGTSATGNTSTNANLIFKVGDSGATTAMTILNNGNVGIGDASPLSLLTVGSGDLFQVNSSGAIAAAVGITSAGGAASLNNNSNFTTAINTGTSTGAVTIGGNANTLAIDTTSWDVSSAGVGSGFTGFASTGAIAFSGGGTFSIDSSAFDVSTAGALSGITGYSQASGNFAIAGIKELSSSASKQQRQIGEIRSLTSDATSDAKLSFEGLTLKTDANVKTLADLQKSVDEQLSNVSKQLIEIQSLTSDAKLSFADYETRIKSVEDLAVALQSQIDELKVRNADLRSLQETAQIEANKNDIDYIKLVLGLDRAENGSLNLLGNLEADGIVAGAFTVKVADEEKKTIGTNYIEPVEKDEDNDGKDDKTGGDGQTYLVKTKAVTKTCKIFTSLGTNPETYTWVEKTKNGDGDYIGFKMNFAEPVKNRTYFDWWIVEEK